MDAVLETILKSPATPTSLALAFVALLGFSLIRGQVVPRTTVDMLLAVEQRRAEDYKAAWTTERARADTLTGMVEQLLTYAETADKVLAALPTPQRGGEKAT